MPNKRDDAVLLAKIEQVAKMLARAESQGRALTAAGLWPDNPPAHVKRALDEAEERYMAHEASRKRGETQFAMAELEAAMEESLARNRRRELAVDKILAGESVRTPKKKRPALAERIIRDMPDASATWDMSFKTIAGRLSGYWKKTGNPYCATPESLVRAIKRAKDDVRDK